MPQYHNTNNWDNKFNVKITPKPLLRRWFKWWPYFVGKKVCFMLEVEDTGQGDLKAIHLFETFREKSNLLRIFRVGQKMEIEGNIIDREGDVIYSIGRYIKNTETLPVFTTTVINTDRWVLGCAGLILGAIVTLVTGIVLGFIDIEKFWKIWIP